MLGFPGLRHHQIAYVTTDLDEALRRVDDAYGLDRHFRISTRENPTHPDQPPLDLALVRAGGTEFELIQPLGAGAEVWSAPLPADGRFALMFHHIAFTVDGSIDDFERYRATWDAERHPVVVDGWSGNDARWFYTDERETLGHLVEHCWFSDGLKEYMKGTIPTYG